jgi:hypothetical protein
MSIGRSADLHCWQEAPALQRSRLVARDAQPRRHFGKNQALASE